MAGLASRAHLESRVMTKLHVRALRWRWCFATAAGLALLAWLSADAGSADPAADLAAEYTKHIRPLLTQYCLSCHSTKAKKGDLDLERFTSLDQARLDLAPWQNMIDQLDSGEMPPKKSAQPKPEERQRLLAFVRGFLDAEARARAGDPGRVVVRRLSNVEYNHTIRDLTGVDLQPARDFPGDGAAGEGFTNAGDALVMSPTLLNKYLNAAKEIAAHGVLLPDGFRFSPSKTRRDWTDEVLVKLRKFHAQYSGDGKLSLTPYLSATVRYRDDLTAGKITIEAIASKEKLNSKYLQTLWQTLTEKQASFPLERIREQWRQAAPKDVEALATEIRRWQGLLWKFNKIGSYMNPVWQEAATPKLTDAQQPKDLDAQQLAQGVDAFRRCFPIYLFFPRIVPDDETICLRLYCREDEPLIRLFLSDVEKQQLEHLWNELRYVSQQPRTELRNYPAFMGFVSQDGKDSFKRVEDVTKEPVQRRATDFEKELEAAYPKHVEALADFATRAYRRPLQEQEKTELTQLYQTLRKKDMPHEEAFRTVLTRVLISPSFLYRIEHPVSGSAAQPVSNWELATRLSYFLWATMPDAELRQAAATGRLTEAKELTTQVERMLKDPKARGLATEFAAQWLHVRDIRANREKNEKLFPTFDDGLRQTLLEETVLFFQDLFHDDRSILAILDADHTFLNDALAKHYGIPGVAGTEWRRVDGVRKFGRGGVLAQGSVLTTQSGASRTSPVLRGNWVVETLLGEKIPKPPKDVPRLPEEEASGDELTVRKMVEKHASVAQCAVCHQRIDPFGFALEKYDPIGRLRDKDLGGRAVDTAVQLKDGTRFDGIDGLRQYLLTQRKDDFVRQFCKKLLGYALGRAVTLSDQVLIEEMVGALQKNEYRVSAAILTVARSKQFRYHRGLEAAKDN
jgi:hypothetical protein